MKTRKLNTWILAADLLWAAVAILGAGALRYGVHNLVWTPGLWLFLLATWLVWVLLSSRMELDGFRGGWRLPAVMSHVFLAVLCEMGVLLALAYLARHYVSRLALLYFGGLLFVGFGAIRCTALLFLRARRRAGDVWRVVVLGTGRVARELANRIERHPEMLCCVVGLLLPDEGALEDLELGPDSAQNSVQLSTFGIIDLLRARQVDELIVALPQPELPEIRNVAASCHESGISVSVVPQPYELYLTKPRLLDIDGLPVLQFRRASPSQLFAHSKRALDITLGTVLGIVSIPALFSAACALRLMKGLAFRWENRCGQFGEQFRMLRLNVDRHVVHSSRFEHLLELLSVTELPQLWNVVKGEMSLVGPRPESPAQVRRYSDWHQQRLRVKPGMTGLAQVHGLREQNSSEQKARFDLQYLMNPSLLADISLLLQTLWTLAMRLSRYSTLIASSTVPMNQPRSRRIQRPPQEILPSAHSTQSSAD